MKEPKPKQVSSLAPIAKAIMRPVEVRAPKPKYQGRNMNLPCKEGCTIGTPSRTCSIHGDKPAAIKASKPKLSLEDRVYTRYVRLVQAFPIQEHKRVRELLVSFLTDTLLSRDAKRLGEWSHTR